MAREVPGAEVRAQGAPPEDPGPEAGPVEAQRVAVPLSEIDVTQRPAVKLPLALSRRPTNRPR